MKRHEATLNHIKSKESIWKCYNLYDSKNMTFQKNQNYGDTKQMSGERMEEKWKGRAQRIYSAVEILCMLL